MYLIENSYHLNCKFFWINIVYSLLLIIWMIVLLDDLECANRYGIIIFVELLFLIFSVLGWLASKVYLSEIDIHFSQFNSVQSQFNLMVQL